MRELKCSKCNKMLPEDSFAKAKDRKSGRRSSCKECGKAYQKQYAADNAGKKKKWKEDNKEIHQEYQAQYHKDNKDARNAQNKEWRDNNKEYLKEYNHHRYDPVYYKQYRADNRERDRKTAQKREAKYRQDPVYRLKSNISRAVRKALNSDKDGASFFEYVPYGLKELKAHLEALFDSQTNWENYGSYWHLDHIIPQSSFNYDSMESEEFRKCWALNNLQPLERIENIKKSNK